MQPQGISRGSAYLSYRPAATVRHPPCPPVGISYPPTDTAAVRAPPPLRAVRSHHNDVAAAYIHVASPSGSARMASRKLMVSPPLLLAANANKKKRSK